MLSHCYNYTLLQWEVYRRKVSVPAERPPSFLFFSLLPTSEEEKNRKDRNKEKLPFNKMLYAPGVSVSCWWSFRYVHLLFPFTRTTRGRGRRGTSHNKIIENKVWFLLWFTSFLFHHCWHYIVSWLVWWIISCSSTNSQLRGNSAGFTFTLLFFYRIQNGQKSGAEQTHCIRFSAAFFSFPSSSLIMTAINNFILGQN